MDSKTAKNTILSTIAKLTMSELGLNGTALSWIGYHRDLKNRDVYFGDSYDGFKKGDTISLLNLQQRQFADYTEALCVLGIAERTGHESVRQSYGASQGVETFTIIKDHVLHLKEVTDFVIDRLRPSTLPPTEQDDYEGPCKDKDVFGDSYDPNHFNVDQDDPNS